MHSNFAKNPLKGFEQEKYMIWFLFLNTTFAFVWKVVCRRSRLELRKEGAVNGGTGGWWGINGDMVQRGMIRFSTDLGDRANRTC
jgi:hypothetical protein